ncbi:MAG: transglutaminase family protein [Pseudomonadales bacterium]|jgi:transglutaminase-like putative cysteine protease|nr:transglutaminase family protein [Pseudomonadales bacterium]
MQEPAAAAIEDPAYLAPGRFVDSDHPAVVAFAEETARGIADPRERAVALYYRVRDAFRYDPYGIDRSEAGFLASWVLAHGRSFCVPKATLLAAAARAVGIPARLGYADVRNHLTSAKLAASMGTDVFAWHGYTELALDGRWVKATPAFNLSLCEKTGVLPLEFDGREDSVFHPFTADGSRHMEYLVDHGTFADVPHAQMMAGWAEHYGSPKDDGSEQGPADPGDFEADAAAHHRGGS